MTEKGICIVALSLLAFAAVLGLYACAYGHDFLHAENNQWLNSLRSRAGYYCCQNQEARRLVDWKRVDNGGYSVIIKSDWIPVPDGAVVTATNILGYALVWLEPGGEIRCFLPGAEG